MGMKGQCVFSGTSKTAGSILAIPTIPQGKINGWRPIAKGDLIKIMAKEQNGTAVTTETMNGNLVLVREPINGKDGKSYAHIYQTNKDINAKHNIQHKQRRNLL